MRAHRIFGIGLTATSVFLGTAAVLSTPAAGGYHASSDTWLYVGFDGGDVLANYDRTGTGNSIVNTRDHMDWPTTIFFKNNAEIDKVKGMLDSHYPDSGSEMHYYLKDNSDYVWDQDGGKKSPNGCHVTDTHIRLYADGDDRLYDPTDGYYIMGTTHFDIDETCDATFGYSEHAATEFCNYFDDRGHNCVADLVWVNNKEPRRLDGTDHVWASDGYLSRVNIA
jgi:hypothetical protein